MGLLILILISFPASLPNALTTSTLRLVRTILPCLYRRGVIVFQNKRIKKYSLSTATVSPSMSTNGMLHQREQHECEQDLEITAERLGALDVTL